MSKSTILIVGGEEPLTAALAGNLQDQDCEVLSSSGVGDAGQRIKALLPDVVVTSHRLSDADLLRLCRQLRSSAADQHLALLMLVSPGDNDGTAGEYPPGAGDSATTELLADQIRGWLRCAQIVRQERDRIDTNGLAIDRRRFSATLDGRELALTPTEFRLLWILARRPGHIFSRVQLAEVCGRHDIVAQERTIDVHIKSIRHKLADRGDLIETVRGVGYRYRSIASQERIEPNLARREHFFGGPEAVVKGLFEQRDSA
jgi:DNA-binding response OmpR family regulator